MTLASAKGNMTMSKGNKAPKPIQKLLVSYFLAILSAFILGWPLVNNAESTQCGIVANSLLAMLFISMIHLGSSDGVKIWIWGGLAGGLSFVAPLTIELCINSEINIWWGLGLMLLGFNLIIFKKARSRNII